MRCSYAAWRDLEARSAEEGVKPDKRFFKAFAADLNFLDKPEPKPQP